MRGNNRNGAHERRFLMDGAGPLLQLAIYFSASAASSLA